MHQSCDYLLQHWGWTSPVHFASATRHVKCDDCLDPDDFGNSLTILKTSHIREIMRLTPARQ